MKTKLKLPKRFKNKWVKALTSGKYSQTVSTLKDNAGYCCLGVACAISGMSEEYLNDNIVIVSDNIPKKDEQSFKSIPSLIKGDNDSNLLVKKLVGFNDDGKSFKWIAAYIKRYL